MSETPLDLARRMLAARLNPLASCGVTAALKDCQTLAAEVVRLTEDRDWWTRCSDCPPSGYPTDKTRCDICPRIDAARKESR